MHVNLCNLAVQAGIPDPPSLKSSLIKQKEIDRRFLEQLLDGSKVENYVIPVPIHAKLRKYQQVRVMSRERLAQVRNRVQVVFV